MRFGGFAVLSELSFLVVARRLIQAPEGRRIFKGMSVEEKLDPWAFTLRDKPGEVRCMKEPVFSFSPRLAERKKQESGLLSGGGRQAPAVGRAMMAKPRLLPLDEPSAGLSPFLARGHHGHDQAAELGRRDHHGGGAESQDGPVTGGLRICA